MHRPFKILKMAQRHSARVARRFREPSRALLHDLSNVARTRDERCEENDERSTGGRRPDPRHGAIRHMLATLDAAESPTSDDKRFCDT